jgi:glutamate dehydrogenase
MDAPSPEPDGLDRAALDSAFGRALAGGEGLLDAWTSAFLSQVASDYRRSELPGVDEVDLAGALADFWRFAWERVDGAPHLRVRPATGRGGRDLGADLVEIAQPDRPFLVDSLMGEVAAWGAEVKALFHPVVERFDRRLSMIQIWIEPLDPPRREALVSRLLLVIEDVRLAVDDFHAMHALLTQAADQLRVGGEERPSDSLSEAVAFLRWLAAGHFVFLGARVYDYVRDASGAYAAEEPIFDPDAGLGVLRDPTRLVLRRSSEPTVLSENLRWRLNAADPLVIAKADLQSVVHRRVEMDYVGVRRLGPSGEAVGETRFVGLFTAQAYSDPARDIPLARRKVLAVMARADLRAGSHNAVRLAHILETYPRDELFQAGVEDLFASAMDILHLLDRPRVRLIARRDPFDRFVSLLLFTPRERYDDRLRQRVGDLLAQAFDGVLARSLPQYDDGPLARVQYIISVTPGRRSAPDLTALEARIAQMATTWGEAFENRGRAGGLPAESLAAYRGAFPIGYRDRYDVAEGLIDAGEIEALGASGVLAVRAFRRAEDSPLRFRFKLYYRHTAPAPLARVLPILADMGLDALVEDGFAVQRRGEEAIPVWVQEFLIEDPQGAARVFADRREPFETTFSAVWRGETESDAFNRLVLALGLSWREASLMRALSRYRRQSGLDPSEAVQAEALSAHTDVTRLILDLFKVRFDPDLDFDQVERQQHAEDLMSRIDIALRPVESLEADRALRRLAALTDALLRTNYYQRSEDGAPKPYISFKIASRRLADLPAPKPYVEIFVASPDVEGVHLRFGPVARGGLRWSDRREDFRTEVLGLVKAQQVKNAVIVPVGSKGGFYPKRLPKTGGGEAIKAGAEAAYRLFLKGLLDLTDNLDAGGAVLPPPRTIAYDGPDSYLVVAADKGTATFSDIANGVAADYGFWLGDAFASGGSVGYDHKAMGITARGAWESIKRHFAEMGHDVARDPTTVIGVGDMSGDVFGNGMLLSRTLLLRAAFDHRHVFIDPHPDAEVSWRERRRLFDLPRSSWDDYDRSKISAGGGVWPRSLKSVPLTDEIRKLLDLEGEAASPDELIRAILKSRADLLYLGGIGAYVKARAETHAEVGDKANDAVRVDGADLRCRVAGEGANLGFTQAGRVEFALAGGRINTDAIDNSAGVDTSDHEVNIKILLRLAERSGEMAPAQREALLASMTDDVATQVLAHNRDQTLALSLMQCEGLAALPAQERFIARLEALQRLDPALEGLPDGAALARRAASGPALTRPELAVLLAYGKLELFDDLIASAAPDDPGFVDLLTTYFPPAARGFTAEMSRHPLRREIIATRLANGLIDRLGATFPGRLRADLGCDARDLAVAFRAAMLCLDAESLWSQVEALDRRTPMAGRMALFLELAQVVRGQTYGLARRARRDGFQVRALTDAYAPGVAELKALVPASLSPFERRAVARRAGAWVKAGAPKPLAHAVALLRPLAPAPAVIDLSRQARWPLAAAAFLFHRVGGVFGFDRLRAAAGGRTSPDDFERIASRRLIEDTIRHQADLTAAVMDGAEAPDEGRPERAVYALSGWSQRHAEAARLAKKTLEDLESSPGGWTFAKLTLAEAALRELAIG